VAGCISVPPRPAAHKRCPEVPSTRQRRRSCPFDKFDAHAPFNVRSDTTHPGTRHR
jgi:hypothetical protein